jgi:hypothetical protein
MEIRNLNSFDVIQNMHIFTLIGPVFAYTSPPLPHGPSLH